MPIKRVQRSFHATKLIVNILSNVAESYNSRGCCVSEKLVKLPRQRKSYENANFGGHKKPWTLCSTSVFNGIL